MRKVKRQANALKKVYGVTPRMKAQQKKYDIHAKKSLPKAETTHVLQTVPPSEKTGAERAASLRAWANRLRRDTPLLSDEDVSREAIYGDRG